MFRSFHFRPERAEARYRLLRFATVTGLLLYLLAFSGCDSRQKLVPVTLSVRPLARTEPQQLEVRAQVAAVQTDVSYKWFADYGSCDPQESPSPLTTFQFAEGSKEDVITVELWRDLRRFGQYRLRVEGPPSTPVPPIPQVDIQFTEIPPAHIGGPTTHADIAGIVTGQVDADLKVVIYARESGVWWVQPVTRALQTIEPDHTWATWTHTGQVYAALVVRSDFVPPRTYDMLPPARGGIFARVIADGRK
jgi:hypothetical protein